MRLWIKIFPIFTKFYSLKFVNSQENCQYHLKAFIQEKYCRKIVFVNGIMSSIEIGAERNNEYVV